MVGDRKEPILANERVEYVSSHRHYTGLDLKININDISRSSQNLWSLNGKSARVKNHPDDKFFCRESNSNSGVHASSAYL